MRHTRRQSRWRTRNYASIHGMPTWLGALALYYAKKGDTSQANEFVNRARAINPSDASLIYTSAVVKTIGNQPAEAVKDLALAIQKGYAAKERD